MEGIYISVSITEYGPNYTSCYLSQSVDDSELESQKIKLDKARKLYWELILAGGDHKVEVHSYDKDIVSRQAWIIMPSKPE